MKIAVIAGDGIGPEVMEEGLKVLRAVRDDVETTDYDLGARRYLRNGDLLTDADLDSRIARELGALRTLADELEAKAATRR